MSVKSTTLLDVARLAGVSTATVNRVLKKQGYVSEEARAKVLAAVESTRYRPNVMARSLRTQRTFTIALREQLGPQAGEISRAVAESVPLAMFAFFEHFPFAPFIQGVAVVVVALFFATSSDSASLVVDMLSTGTAEPGPVRQRVFWGVSEGLVAAMLIILAGDLGLTALQQVITVVGLPVFCLVFMMIPSMVMGFRIENIDNVTVGRRPRLDEFQ